MTPFVSEQTVLLVDDEPEVLESFELILNYQGFDDVIVCRDSRDVLPILSGAAEVGVILLDLIMPYLSGQELLTTLSERYPEIPVIVVTATHEIDIAVECMQLGAFDYLVKPVEKMRLISSVRRAVEKQTIARENRALKQRLLTDELEHPEVFESIITQNSKMISIFRYCEAIARSMEPVLITGETGVGKELIARSIHSLCGFKGEFIGLNIAGLDEHAFSDVIFGHKKGAFTGADIQRDGLIKKAYGGTLFLDEIGDLSPALQIKLLRLLQEDEYFQLGSDAAEKANARFIAATNKNLSGNAEANFRRDLFYRLQTHQIQIPPLRERIQDLPLLVDHFVKMTSRKLDKPIPHYSDGLIALLEGYDFPGNIRELKAMILDAVSSCGSRQLPLDSFKARIFKDNPTRMEMTAVPDPDSNLFENFGTLPTLEKASIHLIKDSMRRAGGNQSIASRTLGITQSALSQRLKRLKTRRTE